MERCMRGNKSWKEMRVVVYEKIRVQPESTWSTMDPNRLYDLLACMLCCTFFSVRHERVVPKVRTCEAHHDLPCLLLPLCLKWSNLTGLTHWTLFSLHFCAFVAPSCRSIHLSHPRLDFPMSNSPASSIRPEPISPSDLLLGAQTMPWRCLAVFWQIISTTISIKKSYWSQSWR